MNNINIPTILKARKMRDFDELFTRRMNGYESVDHYYTDASSINYLSEVSIPVLILNSLDDPFIDPSVFPRVSEIANKNPNVIFVGSYVGGHMGFCEGIFPFGEVLNWGDKVMFEYLQAIQYIRKESFFSIHSS